MLGIAGSVSRGLRARWGPRSVAGLRSRSLSSGDDDEREYLRRARMCAFVRQMTIYKLEMAAEMAATSKAVIARANQARLLQSTSLLPRDPLAAASSEDYQHMGSPPTRKPSAPAREPPPAPSEDKDIYQHIGSPTRNLSAPGPARHPLAAATSEDEAHVYQHTGPSPLRPDCGGRPAGDANHHKCLNCIHKCNGPAEKSEPPAKGTGSPPGEGPAATATEEPRHQDQRNIIQDLEHQVMSLGKQLSELKTRHDQAVSMANSMRLQAQNYIMDARQYGIQTLCRDILVVSDALARLKDQLAEEEAVGWNAKDVSARVATLDTQLHVVFAKHGMTKIDAMGMKYNAYEHLVEGRVFTKGLPPSTVVEVVKEGYRLHGRIVRNALVILSMEQPDEPSGTPTEA